MQIKKEHLEHWSDGIEDWIDPQKNPYYYETLKAAKKIGYKVPAPCGRPFSCIIADSAIPCPHGHQKYKNPNGTQSCC